jgi:hypothetical protein
MRCNIVRDLSITNMQLYFSKSDCQVGYMFRDKVSAVEFTDIEIVKGVLLKLTFSVVFTYLNKTKITCPIVLAPELLQAHNIKISLRNNIIMPESTDPNQQEKDVKSVYVKCESLEDFKFTLTCGLFKLQDC